MVLPADGAEYCRDLWVPCTECDGLGEVANVKCQLCNGCGGVAAEATERLGDLDDELHVLSRLLWYLVIAGFAVVGSVVWVVTRFQITVLLCVFTGLAVLVAALLVVEFGGSGRGGASEPQT